MYSVEVRRKASVQSIVAECGVRYWEDAKVNGEVDEDGSRIPCRDGDTWRLFIDLETGVIRDWPAGTVADVHYKVCDAGTYTLLDAREEEVTSIDGYVPKIMCPGDEDHGFGDYMVMKIDGAGKIENWKVDLRQFDEGQ